MSDAAVFTGQVCFWEVPGSTDLHQFRGHFIDWPALQIWETTRDEDDISGWVKITGPTMN